MSKPKGLFVLLLVLNCVGPVVFFLSAVCTTSFGFPFWVPFLQVGLTASLSSALEADRALLFVASAEGGALLAFHIASSIGRMEPLGFVMLLFGSPAAALLGVALAPGFRKLPSWRRWLSMLLIAELAGAVLLLLAAPARNGVH